MLKESRFLQPRIHYIFPERTSRPEPGNKYYNTFSSGGWNGAIKGKPTDPGCDVLANCVGYANGRFNEIIGLHKCVYLFVSSAFRFIEVAQNYNLPIGTVPRLGAIMVWKDIRYSDSRGHVAIVEHIYSIDSVLTSESAYDSSVWYTKIRNKSDGNGLWYSNSNYRFLGFIYNPAVPYDAVPGLLANYNYYDGGAVNIPDSEYISSQSSLLYKTLNVLLQQTRDVIEIGDNEYTLPGSSGTNLLSYPSLVEAPYIHVKIGDYTFGKYNEKRELNYVNITYPNFITSMSIVKINGQVNMYTINMVYLILVGDDPNFVDKILSTVGYGKIKISYGDYSSPSFVYKEEEAIITKVTQKVNFSTASINYTISCTSSALLLLATNYPYEYHAKEKPSNIIYDMLERASFYHLDDVFPGLTGANLKKNFSKFIATDDLAVEIPAKSYMDPVSYINWLVTYMVPDVDDVSSTKRSAIYMMTIHDDTYADYSNIGGTYFKVTKIPSTYKNLPTYNTYTVDVGYPGGDNPGENLVMDFSVTDDNSWSLLYNYGSSELNGSLQNYTYSIDNQGLLIQNYSPNISLNAIQGKTTAAMKAWWTKMTEFPISATLVIKGLVRPAMLMTYLRVNTYFYGQRHISSGLYIITKLEDKIDGQGYRTTLSLTRIAGADEYLRRETYTANQEVITDIVYNKQSIPEVQKLDLGPDSYFKEVKTADGKSIVISGLLYCMKWVVLNKNTGKVITNMREDPINRMLTNPDDFNSDNSNQYTVCPICNVANLSLVPVDNYYYELQEVREEELPKLFPEIYFNEDLTSALCYQFSNINVVYPLGAIVEGEDVYWHPDRFSTHDLKLLGSELVRRRDGEPLFRYEV